MIKYKIVEVDDANNSIVVRFYTDKITEASLAAQWGASGEILRCRTDYSIDLPLPPPTGAELENLILGAAPEEWLAMQEAKLSLGSTLDALVGKVGLEVVTGQIPPLSPTDALAAAKASKVADIAKWRHDRETSGLVILGTRILTDRASQSRLVGALLSLQQGFVTFVDWKAADNQWLRLEVAEITAIAKAVATHVQLSFSLENQYVSAVKAATTVEEVAAVVLETIVPG